MKTIDKIQLCWWILFDERRSAFFFRLMRLKVMPQTAFNKTKELVR